MRSMIRSTNRICIDRKIAIRNAFKLLFFFFKYDDDSPNLQLFVHLLRDLCRQRRPLLELSLNLLVYRFRLCMLSVFPKIPKKKDKKIERRAKILSTI